MKGMYPHCCGSVPGRGIKHIYENVGYWMQHDLKCRYFVKLDIRKFFDSIDRDILLDKLSKKIKDKKSLEVFKQIIDSAPVACPIGYYTSPWFANLYLESLDWYIVQNLYKMRRDKRIPYVRHYLRYVDDMLLIGTSKVDLEKAIREIQRYLKENYGLEIKPCWEIKKIGKHEIVDGIWKLKPDTYWCDIGGYKFCKDSTILRDGVYLSAKRLAVKMSKSEYYTQHQCQSINARVGWSSHCNNKNFMETAIKPYVDLSRTKEVISHVDKKRKFRSN